jgi:hypothetical protein
MFAVPDSESAAYRSPLRSSAMPLGTSPLFPLGDEPAFLIEHLDAAVAAIGNKESSLRIEDEAVRRVELARSGPFLPHVLRNVPSLSNLTMRALLSPP